MHAFSQDLSTYTRVDLIRVGPVAVTYGDDWEYCVNCCSNGIVSCMLLGLKGDARFTLRHARAIIAEARRLGYQVVHWDRHKPTGQRSFTVP